MSKTKRMIFKGVSLIFAFILAVCPLSFCCNARATEEIVIDILDEYLIDLIVDTLKGWGISFYEGAQEYNQAVREFIFQKLIEYVRDALGIELEAFKTGIEWYTDNFGRRVVNPAGINAFYLFATWLQNELGYTSNDEKQVTSSDATMGDITLYQVPILIGPFTNAVNQDYIEYVQVNSSNPVFMYVTQSNTSYYFKFISSSSFSIERYYIYSDHTELNGTFNSETLSGTTWKWIYNTGSYTKSYINETFNVTTDVAVKGAIQASTPIVPSGDVISVETGNIVYPNNDPSYSSGMSIIYYPDGSIGYIQINWPETVSVDNLPAIVSTGRISNLDVSAVTLPFSGFINMMSDGLNLITDIIYNFPSAIVSFALAIISATIVFGVIKVLKEH